MSRFSGQLIDLIAPCSEDRAIRAGIITLAGKYCFCGWDKVRPWM
jgi:hypothetical protein